MLETKKNKGMHELPGTSCEVSLLLIPATISRTSQCLHN